MNQIETSIMSFFDILGYIIISQKLVKDMPNLHKKINLVLSIILIVSISHIMGVLGVSSIGDYSFAYGIIILMGLTIYLYRGSFKETTYIYIITTIILLIIQFLVLASLQSLNVYKLLDFKGGLIAQSIILSISYITYKFVGLNYIFNYTYKNNRLFDYLILNMFVILSSVLAYRYIETDGLLRDILIVGILSIGMVYVNGALMKNGLKNEYEEKMLRTYEKYFPVIEELMKELRSKQHDFDNHIQAINMLSVTSTNLDSMVNSMKQYVQELEFDIDIRNLIKLDNKLLAGFLYEKAIKAKEKNIDFQITIEDYEFKTNLKDYELIEIIGNLIDNAFETGIEGNVVKLTLKREKDMSVIEVKNKHPYLSNSTINKFFKPSYSTKLIDNYSHGFGLPNIKGIIKRYNGVIDVLNESIDESNFVVFRILLR